MGGENKTEVEYLFWSLLACPKVVIFLCCKSKSQEYKIFFDVLHGYTRTDVEEGCGREHTCLVLVHARKHYGEFKGGGGE